MAASIPGEFEHSPYLCWNTPASVDGSTVQPCDRVMQAIRDLSLSPECPVSQDLMPQAEDTFPGIVSGSNLPMARQRTS